MAKIEQGLLEGRFPPEFLAEFGPQFYEVVQVLAGMAGRGEFDNIRHSAELFRLLVNAAAVVAAEVQKKAGAEWAPRWVI